jgi:hypothetical protein
MYIVITFVENHDIKEKEEKIYEICIENNRNYTNKRVSVQMNSPSTLYTN